MGVDLPFFLVEYGQGHTGGIGWTKVLVTLPSNNSYFVNDLILMIGHVLAKMKQIQDRGIWLVPHP